MSEDTIVKFSGRAFRDELTEVVRAGARRMLFEALVSEVERYCSGFDDRTEDGRRAVVRNGYQPEREVLTGVGSVPVKVPKTRDRLGQGRCFRSVLVPPYLKKARRVEAVVPWLYLKGLSTNDFGEALKALFGESVKGLSAATICRLKEVWESDYEGFRQQDWRGHEMVYLWADGISTRMPRDR